MVRIESILVVDDEDTIRELVAVALEDEGYRVRTAADGAQALRLVCEEPPELIILDMRMPVMDGWAFAQAHRARPGPHAAVIVLTAGHNPAGIAAEIGADGYLAKPFELGRLLGLVAQTLEARRNGCRPDSPLIPSSPAR